MVEFLLRLNEAFLSATTTSACSNTHIVRESSIFFKKKTKKREPYSTFNLGSIACSTYRLPSKIKYLCMRYTSGVYM